MALYFASLNSGSNGNCYYVGNETDAVLIDAGISCREIRIRLHRLGLGLDLVRGIFISHEHTDHTRGIEVLARRHRIPVFATKAAFKSGKLEVSEELTRHIRPGKGLYVGSLRVHPFLKQHDTVDPVSFTVNCNGSTVGVMTDIGLACDQVIRHFRECQAVFLETNYDDEMLENGPYPWYLKERIRGDYGHLSNRQALELFTAHRSPALSHLLLSHLSQENNHSDKVLELFSPHTEGIRLAVASRYGETELYRIGEPQWRLF